MRQEKSQPQKKRSTDEVDPSWFVAAAPVSASRTERSAVQCAPTLDDRASWAEHELEPERWDGMS